jgi:putative PIN family toxin of toxin-antitoxin system
MRATLDTNVLVSALLSPGGAPAEVVRMAAAGRFRLCLADTIIAEVRRVVARPRMRERHPDVTALADRFMEAIASLSEVAIVEDPPKVVEADPQDDHVLECARLLQADVIVSGDRHLLALGQYDGIPIVSPAAFVSELAWHQARWPDDTAE